MSEPLSVESILSQIEKQEKEYDWLGAVESYRKALALVPERDFLKLGEIHERLGCAFYRAAMQAESKEEFRERMRQAVANYEKAKESYGRLSEPGKTPKMLRCDAMISYEGYWLSKEVLEKKNLIDACWRLTKECLKAFEEAEEAWEYGKTFNQLSMSALFGFFLEWNVQTREKMLKQAMEHGERAITFLSTFKDPSELARAYAKTVVLGEVFALYFQDLDERESSDRKLLSYWQKAQGLSEEIAMVELLYPVFGPDVLFGLEGTDEALANYRKALEYARKTRDKFFVGCALDWLVYHTRWRINATEDPDEGERLNKTALQYSLDARHQFSQISFISPRTSVGWIEAPQAEYYASSAVFETDPRKKRDLVEKALEATPHLMKLAEDSGYPENLRYANHVLGLVLTRLAMIETNSDKKKRLLEEALEHRKEAIRLTEQFTPFMFWNQGRQLGALARTKSELANLVKEPETRKKLLQEAIMEKEGAFRNFAKFMAFYEMKGSAPSLFAIVGWEQYEYGDLLIRLHECAHNKEHLRKAVEAFEDAAEQYQKPNYISRMAECYWKAAQACDSLDEHLKAAEHFDLASINYQKAAEKIPQLKDFYQDHALYMRAWSEIERARHQHQRQEYGAAKEHFEKAAQIHRSLKQWSYLASNYAAWGQLEEAEGLSRKEQSEEAIQVFEQAAILFKETQKSLNEQLGKIEDIDEKQMATNMLKAADQRHEYCIGRIALEEARILDKEGDHYSSSEKYGLAAGIFEKIDQVSESEEDRKESRFIMSLSRAWQKMTRAEAEASPALYAEASQLFEEAKEHSPNEQAKMLALGHSRFCKALEEGTIFTDTRDVDMHNVAIQHLDSAASYYMKAGFEKASEYAEATELLFDAFMYMDGAKRERDPEKKARLYLMIEKVLQTSADSFMKAEHSEKREQVLRLLEKTEKERELAVSLTELLHAPTIVSTTTTFPTPTPTKEEAVGLEKFENADIQANLITRRKELKVDENLDLEIEFINAGKGPAVLIKVTEIIPHGFELTEKPQNYRVEDGYINMKGKRLNPLKTEEVKLVLKPKVRGVFPIKPRIFYLDESGKEKSHEPEPITITVKELGIRGWLRGES